MCIAVWVQIVMGSGKRILSEAEGGCYLVVEVSPGAEESKFIGGYAWRSALRISIAAKPVSGRANQELIRFLEERLHLAKGGIAIVSGQRSRRKRVFIPISIEEAARGLGLDEHH